VPTPATQAPGEGQVDLAAYAWVALGKLCMADEGLAKRTAPLFVQVSRQGPTGLPVLVCLHVGGLGAQHSWPVCMHAQGTCTDSNEVPGIPCTIELGHPCEVQGACLSLCSVGSHIALTLCLDVVLCLSALGCFCPPLDTVTPNIPCTLSLYVYLQEALRSPSPVSRNNCLVAVCDMAIHFTALVDSHLPRLAALIRDPHELIRKQVGGFLGDVSGVHLLCPTLLCSLHLLIAWVIVIIHHHHHCLRIALWARAVPWHIRHAPMWSWHRDNCRPGIL
jgi:hypothetical protein